MTNSAGGGPATNGGTGPTGANRPSGTNAERARRMGGNGSAEPTPSGRGGTDGRHESGTTGTALLPGPADGDTDPGPGKPAKMSRKARRAAARADDSPERRARREAWEADRRIRRRHTMILVSGLFGLLLIVAGAIGFGIYQTKKTPPPAVPSNLSTRLDGIVAGGSGAVTVEVYADYECAGCKSFQSTAFEPLTSMMAKNQITLVYHPVAMLDKLTTTRYSSRAADSAACAADVGKFLPYTQSLYANQPKVHSAGLSDSQMIQIAGDAGIIDPAFAQCVRASKYDNWIAHQTAAAAAHPVTTAPVVLVDGAPIAPAGTVPTASALQAAVQAAVANPSERPSIAPPVSPHVTPSAQASPKASPNASPKASTRASAKASTHAHPSPSTHKHKSHPKPSSRG
jgi:protein-disulfide isomerase